MSPYDITNHDVIYCISTLAEDLADFENPYMLLGVPGPDYDRDILEYWIVTDRLARLLKDRGEAVEYDWHGLTVWGRTTSGQSIAMDSVIQDIARDLPNK